MLPLFGRPGAPLPRPAPVPVPVNEAPVVEAGKRRQILLEPQRIDYQLVRRKRRTIGFSIDDRGLIVSAPRWVTIGEIERALQEKRGWILRKLAEWSDYAQRRETLNTSWADGSEIRYLGQAVQIRLVDAGGEIALQQAHEGLRLLVPFAQARTEASLQPVVEGWLKARAQAVFDERITLYAARLGRAPRQWRLSNARTLWGSCTADQVIRLNWRLVNLPVPLIDYVVAHERWPTCAR
ncbi:MAG: SprT family zinc-dependent metalloprotease [Burkholderiaceae bacterium]